MISDAKLGKFDVVLVLRSDRFARNRAHAALYKQLLKDVGVEVISVTEPVEEGSPAAVILEGMNEVIAEWYSVDLSVKITDAKRRRAESGLLNGMLPFGYEKGADGIAEHVHDESKLVRQAYEMYSSGNYTCQQIASWLNTTGTYPRTHRKERKARSSIWSKSSVQGMLSNPLYTGDVTYKGKRLPGKHQPIVDNELFETVQAVKRQHRRGLWTYTPKHRTYLLGGILFCARCGTKLWAQHLSGKDYYREEVSRRGLPCTGTNHTVRADIFEAQVEQIILSLTLPESWRALVLNYLSSSEEREAVLREKRSLEEKRRRLYRAYVDGIPEDDYRREILAIEARLRGMKDVHMEEVFELGDHVERLIEAWHHATKEEKRQILATMLGVHVDLTSQQVVALAFKPAFKPLFKAWLDNDDDGGKSPRLALGKIDVVHGDLDWIPGLMCNTYIPWMRFVRSVIIYLTRGIDHSTIGA